MRLPAPLDRLDGAPPSLPRPLDTASERWWRLTPRARAAILLVVLVAGLAVAGGRVTRSQWGEPVEVAVAARDLPAGHHLGPDDLRTARWPEDLVPDGALAADADGTLATPLPRDTVATRAHVAEGGLGALVGQGRAAVALPTEVLAGHGPGTRVDLVTADGQGTGMVVARDARVLVVEGERAWVEVDAEAAADVAVAGQARSVMVVIHGG